jgi:Uma2 family endonuclease
MGEPATTLPREPPQEEALDDQRVILQGASWADYQRLLALRGESAVPRLTYLEGRLEIMSPSRAREIDKSMIGCLVEAFSMETGVGITPYGSWTLERKDVERGLEPDECYVLGDADDPLVPDLAIEVIRTSGGLSKLEVYRKLGVREVWLWRLRRFELFALRDDQYEPIARSELLPGLDLTVLVEFLGVRPMTSAVRAYRRRLRGEAAEGGGAEGPR